MLNAIKKIFSRDTKEEVTLENIEDIISAYGQILQDANAPILRNENELPYPKETIRKALFVAIKITKDQSMRGHLKSCYVSLADWQKNVKTKNIMDLDINNCTPEQVLECFDEEAQKKSQKETEILWNDIKDL